jgi:hypothetical protein
MNLQKKNILKLNLKSIIDKQIKHVYTGTYLYIPVNSNGFKFPKIYD